VMFNAPTVMPEIIRLHKGKAQTGDLQGLAVQVINIVVDFRIS